MTESEICREALKADVENLQAYCDGFFKKVDRVRSFGPWLLLATPMAIPLLRFLGGRKTATQAPAQSPINGKLAALMLGVRLFRQYAPLVRSVLSQFMARRRSASQSRSPAANI